jgi:hypothetical protein
MFRRSGHRFADKNMRKRRTYSHFLAQSHPLAIQFERKWL